MITLYHAPRSRSSRIIWLLEELGADYKIELVPIVRGDGTGSPAPDSYRAIHPLRKVPAIKIFDEVVYESGAICLYLTDSHPKREIGPLPGHNDRAEYVRWLFFYAGIEEEPAHILGAVVVSGERSDLALGMGVGEIEADGAGFIDDLVEDLDRRHFAQGMDRAIAVGRGRSGAIAAHDRHELDFVVRAEFLQEPDDARRT